MLENVNSMCKKKKIIHCLWEARNTRLHGKQWNVEQKTQDLESENIRSSSAISRVLFLPDFLPKFPVQLLNTICEAFFVGGGMRLCKLKGSVEKLGRCH